MEVLTSRKNPLCVHLRKLARNRSYRRETGEYLADGEKLLREAILWGAPVRRVIVTPDRAAEVPDGVEGTVVAPELMAYLSPMESPQGVLFTVALPGETLPQVTGARYLVLDSLQDPGNVGTIWRTADGLGADGVFLVGECADPYNPKTVRATMGACFRLPVWETTGPDLAALLRAAQVPLYAAGLSADSLRLGRADLSRCAVVIGNEGRGVTAEVMALCEKTVKIPMRERCESLNAAAAAAVILWEMARD